MASNVTLRPFSRKKRLGEIIEEREKVKCFFSMNKHGDYYIKITCLPFCFTNVYRHSSNLNTSPWQHLRIRNLAYIQPVCQYLQYRIEIPRPPQEFIQIYHHFALFHYTNSVFIYILLRTQFVVVSFATDKHFELVDTTRD